MLRIAVIRRNGLGDLLCTFPLIVHLKKIYPDASFTLFLDQKNACLMKYLPFEAEIVIWPQGKVKYLHMGLLALKKRGKKFDLAISAKTSPMKMMNLFLFLLGAKKRIATIEPAWHARLINEPRLFDPHVKKHQALKCLHLIAPDMQTIPTEYYPHIEPCRKLTNLQNPILLISASTTNPRGRLSPEKYAEVLNRLNEQISFSVIILGQKMDAPRAQEMARLLKMPHEMHLPRNFDEFMVLLNSADIFFVSDGGVAHLAAALGKVALVLFGGCDPTIWRPLSDDVHVLSHLHHVEELTSDEIFAALQEVFNYERLYSRSRLSSHPCQPISTAKNHC